MFFAQSPNIESLLGWFKSSPYDDKNEIIPEYLCLIVAGNLNFNKFFGDFSQNLETFDLASGRDVALFLYSSTVEYALPLAKSTLMKPDKNRYNFHGLGFNLNVPLKSTTDRPYKVISYGEIDVSSVQSSLRRDAHSFSKDIIDHFNLNPDEYPCIIMITRKSPERPFLLSLGKEDDQKNVLKFFHELNKILHENRKVSSWLQEFSSVPQQLVDQESLLVDLRRKVLEIKEKAAMTERAYQNEENEIRQKAALFGVNKWPLVESFNVPVFINHLKVLMEPSKQIDAIDQVSSEKEELRTNYKLVLKPLIKEFQKSEKKLTTFKNTVAQINARISELENNITDIRERYSLLTNQHPAMLQKNDEVNSAVATLVEYYNLKFKARERYKKVKEFVEEIVSWVKIRKDLQN
jgi:predicted  nucleic acid-binding Zn-ribbon protein